MSDRLPENCGFIRETQTNLYDLYDEGAEVADFIQKIVPEGTSRTELYTMSVTQYDFKPSCRKYPFDFYFHADSLYDVEVCFNNERFIFSYEHCPTDGNPYHFQFYAEDSSKVRLPRKAQKKSEQNRNKMIADVIFENVLSEAVCFTPEKLKSYKDFPV